MQMHPEKSDLHIHSNYSDAYPTINAISDRASALRLDTIAITDHFWPSMGSQRAGMNLIKKRREDIEIARSNYDGLRILDGAEIDITHDGTLAPVAGNIEQFDLVIGSIHWRCTPEKWAKSTIKAAEENQFQILGHFDGYLMSFDSKRGQEVAEALARNAVAVELSFRYPPVFSEFIEIARDAGCRFSLGSDAHKISQIGEIGDSAKLAKAYSLKLFEI